jgi:general secretion pathway protein D
VLGRLFARNKDENVETDILMTLTPHVVKRPDLSEEDFRSFEVGADSQTVLFEAPVIPPPAPSTPPSAGQRIEPIRPPAPAPSPTPTP